MSKAHILKNLDKKLEQEDKRQEVGYVRAEKAADEAMSRKLAEAYGAGGLRRDNTGRSRGWSCSECRFVNFESRLACANCLSPSDAHKASIAARAPSIAIAPTNCDPATTLTKSGGRYYRSHCHHGTALKQFLAGETASSVKPSASPPPQGTRADDEGDDGVDENDDGADDFKYDHDRKLYIARVPCAAECHKYVVGAQAKTLKDIERTSGAKLIVPKAASVDAPAEDFVTVEAPSAQALRLAQMRISAIALEAKDRVEYTHFLSIPLGPIPSARAAFTTLFEDMKQALVNEATEVEPSLFQRPSKVHITLLMLSLRTQSDLNLAKMVLESLEPELQHIFSPTDCITLKGLNVMSGDPTSAHVVYMELEKSAVQQRLQALVGRINQAFLDAGIAKPRDVQNNGKLHATIMNSKFRKGRAHVPFNATDTLRLFGDKSFGTHKLRSIEINALVSSAATEDGFYVSETSIGFP